MQPIHRENDPRWEILGDYVREVADKMGFSCWHFDISHDAPPNEQERARIEYTFQTLAATIYFGDIFFEDECAERQRHTVTHELCHLVETTRMGCIEALKVEECISDALWNQWWKHYDREREKAIDWFSALIAPRMPLIDWTKENSCQP